MSLSLIQNVPESEVYHRSVHFHCGRVVLEDCRDVFRGETICGVADQHTCLSDATVANDHQLYWDGLLRHLLVIKILCGGKSLITVKNPTLLANNNSQN